MSSSANVLSVRALEDLKAALGRFGGEAQELLNAATQDVRRTLDWLSERQGYWQGEVRRRQEIVVKANSALAACRASGYRDPKTGAYHQPPCDAQWEAVRKAQAHLAEAEAELRNVHQWTRLAQQAATDYQQQAQRLATLLSNDLSKASALLGRSITVLQSYAAITPSESGTGMMLMERSGTEGGNVDETRHHIMGGAEEVKRLREAVNRLSHTDKGRAVSEAICERGTALRFGTTEANVMAYFDPERNEIVISDNLQNEQPEILAAHLAHEGTHVQWNREDSVNQEYHAFQVQAAVWNQLKGDKTDKQCDLVEWMISLGEKDARRMIRSFYPDLPEDA
jgi:hypothetical protein